MLRFLRDKNGGGLPGVVDQGFEFLNGVVLVIDGFKNLPCFFIIPFIEFNPGVENMDVS